MNVHAYYNISIFGRNQYIIIIWLPSNGAEVHSMYKLFTTIPTAGGGGGGGGGRGLRL